MINANKCQFFKIEKVFFLMQNLSLLFIFGFLINVPKTPINIILKILKKAKN